LKRLKSQPVDWKQVDRYLAAATKKLATAKKVLPIDDEAAFQLAYEAMLKGSLGLMLSHGFRPRSTPGHHMAIIEFAEKQLGAPSHRLVALFDRMRRKRNQALYDATGLITRTEAEQALDTAAKYLASVDLHVAKRHPQRKLI
jgi:uncharacterized protein (UPF0332 family)